MTLIVSAIQTKKMKEKTKTLNLIVDNFSLIFVNHSFVWMIYLFGVNTIISLVHINLPVLKLEPRQSNLSNPEAYSEPC